MPVEVLREIQRRLPQVRLWNFYGQTEIAPLATVLKPEDQIRKAGSAGKPVLNVEARVVDDRMENVSPSEVAEIVHRSPSYFSAILKGCGHFLIYLDLREAILVHLLPELFPPAFCDGEGSKVQDDLRALLGPAHA